MKILFGGFIVLLSVAACALIASVEQQPPCALTVEEQRMERREARLREAKERMQSAEHSLAMEVNGSCFELIVAGDDGLDEPHVSVLGYPVVVARPCKDEVIPGEDEKLEIMQGGVIYWNDHSSGDGEVGLRIEGSAVITECLEGDYKPEHYVCVNGKWEKTTQP